MAKVPCYSLYRQLCHIPLTNTVFGNGSLPLYFSIQYLLYNVGHFFCLHKATWERCHCDQLYREIYSGWTVNCHFYTTNFLYFSFLQGLIQLYDFKQKHPEADIEPFLRKSSQFFQNYIERGLKRVEMERLAEGKAMSNPSSENGSNSGIFVFIYFARMKY